MSAVVAPRACWCGHSDLSPYSADYSVCHACGTLVSRATVSAEAVAGGKDDGSLYSRDYWHARQTEHHKLPDIVTRARLDLPERCTHWLNHLLPLKLPPARVLEVGCAHGAFVALLGWAGYQATGTEMSPWVVDFGKQAFGIDIRTGRLETLNLPPQSFDVIVLNDVIEHLPDPIATLKVCAELLSPTGFFLIQTPEYKEHLTYEQLVATKDLFLKHMDHNNEEHLYLYSRRSLGRIFEAIGLAHRTFFDPVYSYDMYAAISRAPLATASQEAVQHALEAVPTGRLVQGLLDKAAESKDRWWAIKRLSEGREAQPSPLG